MQAGKLYLRLSIWNDTNITALRAFDPLAAVLVIDTDLLVTVFTAKCNHRNLIGTQSISVALGSYKSSSNRITPVFLLSILVLLQVRLLFSQGSFPPPGPFEVVLPHRRRLSAQFP